MEVRMLLYQSHDFTAAILHSFWNGTNLYRNEWSWTMITIR
jgi:hypothetical protein